jgi:hypothetical protein
LILDLFCALFALVKSLLGRLGHSRNIDFHVQLWFRRMGNGRGFAGDFDEDEVVNKVLDFVVVYSK